jgi:UDP-MurNAc hydroxylase
MEIEYVTHASLRLRTAAGVLLTDPFYFLDPLVEPVMCHFPPRALSANDLGRLDWVYSSHAHPDHSHPETLARLRDQIGMVLLPAERPDLERRYRDLGFTDVVLLENGRSVRLADDLEVTSVWDSAVDSVLFVRAGDTVVFHQNDCRLGVRTLAALAARFAVDYAFLNYTWVQDLYPLLLPRTPAELGRLMEEKERDCVAYQAAVAELLRPRLVVPYSMTMTYFQPDQLHLNGHGRLTPPVFRRRLEEAVPGLRCEVLQPGDVIEVGADRVRRMREENLWGEDLDGYLANVAAFAARERDRLPAFRAGDPAAVESVLRTHFAARLAAPFVPHLAGQRVDLHVVGDAETRSYTLDLASGVFGAAAGEGEPAFLELTLPASIAEALLAGAYDPFSALYSYRVGFHANARLDMPPQDEVWLYVLSVVSLFRPDMQDALLRDGTV